MGRAIVKSRALRRNVKDGSAIRMIPGSRAQIADGFSKNGGTFLVMVQGREAGLADVLLSAAGGRVNPDRIAGLRLERNEAS